MILKIFAGLILFEIGHVFAAAIFGLLSKERDYKMCYLVGGIVLIVAIICVFLAQWCMNILGI